MIKKIIIILLFALLTILIFLLVFSNKNIGYHLIGNYVDQKECYVFNGFIISNNKSNLLTYSLEVVYSDKDIKSLKLYYLKDNEKYIVLGHNGLSGYGYEKRNLLKNNYEYVSRDLLMNIDNLYIDLFLDSELTELYKTIKVYNKKINK